MTPNSLPPIAATASSEILKAVAGWHKRRAFMARARKAMDEAARHTAIERRINDLVRQKNIATNP